jgi:predicted nucleic acid-binding protein
VNFLDANVILRHLTGDEPRAAQRCAQLFERAERGREVLYTTAMVVAEVIWVLSGRYHHPKANIVDGVRRLLNTPHLLVEEREVLLLAIQLFEQHPIDFIDAYNGAVMQARGLETVHSYDEDFDRIPGVRRLEP